MAADDFSADLGPQVAGLRTAIREVNVLFEQLEITVKGRVNAATGAAGSGFKKLAEEISLFSNNVQKDLASALKSAVKGGGDFAGVFDKMRVALEDLVIQLGVVNPVLNALFGGDRGTLAGISSASGKNFKEGGLLGSLFSGIFDLFEGRAAGGPVNAGIPYIVGERGPELFVPPTAGRIAANTGRGPVSITMNISTNDAHSFRASQAQISAMVLDGVRRAQRIR